MRPKKLKTRILSFIMSVLMLLGTMPDTGLAVLAADDTDPDTDGKASFIEEYLSDTGLLDAFTEYEDDNDPAEYKIWIGDVQITEANKDDVLGDGKVTYDPVNKILNLNDAVLDKKSTKEGGAPSTSANICTSDSLTITGKGTLTNAHNGIVFATLAANKALTIDADLTIDVANSGIATAFCDIVVKGGNTVISSAEGICLAAVYANSLLKGGSLKLTGEVGLSGAGGSIIINGTAVDITANRAAIAMDSPQYSTLEIYSPSFIAEPSGAKIGLGKINDKDVLAVTEANGDLAKNVKISVKSGVETKTVTFDLNGHGYGTITPRVVGKGDKVCRPSDPSDMKLVFSDWYKESACTNKYDFDTPVNEDLTLYAQWVDKNGNPVEPGEPSEPGEPGEPSGPDEPAPWPDPIYSSGSALDPVPDLLPGTTTDLYLVKGQKFHIGDGWTINKEGKKVISISKKGDFNAKKEGTAVITGGKENDTCSITVHVTAPKLETKSLKLVIDKADAIASGQIVLNYDHENYDKVFWHSASPDVATVDQDGKVTAVSKGTAKVSAYINGKAYTCSVSVKEKASAENRTIHVAKGASKPLSIKDLKKPVWSVSDTGVVTVKNNKKIIADNPGHTVLTASGNNITYSVDVFVEDLDLTDDAGFMKPAKGANKYDLKMAVGEDTCINLNDSVEQAVIFKSSKPDIAFIDEYGSVRARSKGSCKFTTKIDGKTITINVTVSEAK